MKLPQTLALLLSLAPSISGVCETPPLNSKESSVILASPTYGFETFLLNDEGKVQKTWKSPYRNSGGARLLPGGGLLRVVAMPLEKTFSGAGVGGGGIEILAPEGEVEWRFWNSVTHHMTFGDALMLPNGNILTAALEWKSLDEAEKAGRDVSTLHEQGLFVPALMEFRPKGNFAGLLVWKWSLWDHLYQGRHPALPNYSFPNAKPGCVDINAYSGSKRRKWVTPFQIDYNAAEDLIAVTVRELGEVWLIDHSTSSSEAAKDEGGTRGKGGRILQRLGATDATNRLRHVLVGGVWSEKGTHGAAELDLVRLDGSVLKANGTAGAALEFKINQTPVQKFSDREGKFPGSTKVAALLDGGGVYTTGIHGAIVRTTSEGATKWIYQNNFGKVNFSTRDSIDGEACCGGTKTNETGASPAATIKPKAQRPKIQAAPVDRLRVYPASVFDQKAATN